MTPGFVLSVLALSLLVGCSAVTGIGSRPLDTYELRPLPTRTAVVRGSRHLVVEVPTASGALDTDRIAVKPNALEVAYLPGASWVDTAPEHLQLLMARSLGGTGAFALVSTGDARADADWYLETDLQAFEVDIDAEGAARATVRIRATIVSSTDRIIRGTRVFEQSVPVAGTEIVDVVPGFERAATSVLRALADWAVATAR